MGLHTDTSRGRRIIARADREAQREQKRMEREQKRAEREEKKARREEQKRIASLPSAKFTPIMVKSIVSGLDRDGKFSEKKVKALEKKVAKLGRLTPRQLASRIKGRKFQVEMLEAVFETAKENAGKGGKKK